MISAIVHAMKSGYRWVDAPAIYEHRFSPVLYPNHNTIERMFCHLKDFRRTVNFMAAACIAATVNYWP